MSQCEMKPGKEKRESGYLASGVDTDSGESGKSPGPLEDLGQSDSGYADCAQSGGKPDHFYRNYAGQAVEHLHGSSFSQLMANYRGTLGALAGLVVGLLSAYVTVYSSINSYFESVEGVEVCRQVAPLIHQTKSPPKRAFVHKIGG